MITVTVLTVIIVLLVITVTSLQRQATAQNELITEQRNIINSLMDLHEKIYNELKEAFVTAKASRN